MLTNQAIRRLVPRLAAYLPNTLTRQILQEGLPTPGQAHWLTAATIFTDMSGFTTMTEKLAADGPRGVEELNRTLLMTFTPMINAIQTAGGAVSHFHGDAMTVYFVDDDGQSATRALACARFLQSLMQARSGQKFSFELTMRIGVGYGRCLAVVVGDPARSLEFVLAGTAVDEAVAAQNLALEGQVIASQAVLQKAGWPADTPFRQVTEIFPVPTTSSGIYWDAHATEKINQLAAIAPNFIHPNLYERLQDSNVQYVAEHRPITSLFVRFEGIDYDAPDAGSKLQSYYEWARGVIARYGGDNCRLNRLLTGDIGSQLHILFGAPVAPDTPEQALRCALTLQQERPLFITGQQIGVAAGRGFACGDNVFQYRSPKVSSRQQ
jgi:class 3 adenylate cyclase